jgi:DNA helicase-2/ATP-dependent DNA helicase PcrA
MLPPFCQLTNLVYNALMPRKKAFNLNPSQQKAVEHKYGPLLVVAGAGTGKTRVITERIKYLIDTQNVKPQEVLALTFTEKASKEMTERVEDIMPLGYEEPWIYTFHAFCDRILKTSGLELGLDISYKLLSSPEQWLLFRKNLYKFDLHYYRPLGNPTKFVTAILKFISRLQDENIQPEDLHKYAQSYDGDPEEKERWQELAGVYQKYQDIKLEQSKMDFGDLITWTIRLFMERPNVLQQYRKQFKHVLVDEFQDTNYSQYELIKMLCPPEMGERSLVAVGDDSQSIYKFRGAAVSNIIEFKEDYPEANMVTLVQNYRSTQPILDASYNLIQQNNPDTLETKLGISKKLVSEAELKPVDPQILLAETGDEEVETVILKIKEVLDNEPQYKYKDIAILARANNHLDVFVLALRKYGLPYQLVGNRGLYDREEVRDVLSFLRILINPLDTISLYRVLNIEVLNIPQEQIAKMLASARYRKVDLWDVVKENPDESVQKLYKIITKYQEQITKATPVEIVYSMVNELNYVAPFVQNETIENQLSIKNLDLFLTRIKTFEVDYRSETNEIPTIVDFLDFIELMIEAGENPAQAEIEDVDTIKLMTVHASKGLEFPVVFIVNAVSDRFPTRDRGETIEIPDELIKETLPIGDAHVQEERRLFYVGMTRAQKYLFITLGKNYGGKRDKNPSGFIPETGLEITPVNLEELKTQKAQTGLFGSESEFRQPKLEKVAGFTPSFLSYTQISTYLTCPLKYKFSYVLSIPTPPSAALSFGSTIHDTLRDFHTKLMFDANVSYEDLLNMYERNWQPLGYDNKDHRELSFENGKNILQRYFQDNRDLKVKPLAIEKSFNVRIDGLRFYGRIDRIDPLESGVEIIDYKTGSTKDQKYVDSDAQVAFYAIGTMEALNMQPQKLTYYFVEEGVKVTTTRTLKQLDDKKEEVKEVVGKIKTGNFDATPGMHCKWCDYKDICPLVWKE